MGVVPVLLLARKDSCYRPHDTEQSAKRGVAGLIWFRKFWTRYGHVHTKCTPVLDSPSLLPHSNSWTEKWNDRFSIHFWEQRLVNYLLNRWKTVKIKLTRWYKSLEQGGLTKKIIKSCHCLWALIYLHHREERLLQIKSIQMVKQHFVEVIKHCHSIHFYLQRGKKLYSSFWYNFLSCPCHPTESLHRSLLLLTMASGLFLI